MRRWRRSSARWRRWRRLRGEPRAVRAQLSAAPREAGVRSAPMTARRRAARRRARQSAPPARAGRRPRGRKAAAASTAKARPAAKSGGRARSSTKTPARARTPRGANREAVLTVVRERPGVSAGELAVASGDRGETLYSLLGRLTAGGELAKRELPGGRTGYALASSDAPVTAAVDSPTIPEDRSLAHTDDAATAQDQPPADRRSRRGRPTLRNAAERPSAALRRVTIYRL